MGEEMDPLERKLTRVTLEAEQVLNTSSISYPNAIPNRDFAFNFPEFQKNFSLKIIRLGPNLIEFDLIGVDASFANALRRILIAEVATMAIEHVFVMCNTSIVQDEVLSHRMGLVPILADPSKFLSKSKTDDPTDMNTIVMELKVKCSLNPEAGNATNPADKYINSNVYSRDIKWIPKGNQAAIFSECPIRPAQGDILLAKLRPGQEIDLELHCEKNIGKEHAKWTPVSCASYRLMPDISILKPITGDAADKFVKCFSPGVAGIRVENGVRTAVILNPRNDAMTREVLRHPEFADKVRLDRIRDHFIFSVETVGSLPPTTVIREALSVLITKCANVQQSLGLK